MITESVELNLEKNCGAIIGRTNEVGRKVDDIMDKNNNFRGDGMMQVLSSNLENLEIRDCVLPQSVCTLVNKILDVQKNDVVAEINCGVGSYLDATIKAYPEIKLVGVEKEHDKLEVANAILGYSIEDCDIHRDTMNDFVLRQAPQYEHKINLCCANPFYYYNSYDVQGVWVYDKAFSYMSERILLREEKAFGEYIRDSKLYHTVFYHTTSDWYFNEMLIKSIKREGKAVALMNSGNLGNKLDEQSRRFFLENGYIEAIIKLPEKLALRMRSMVLVVLSHGNNSVRFVDASSCYVDGRRSNELSAENIATIVAMINQDGENSKSVPVEALLHNGVILNPERYFIPAVDVKSSIALGAVLKAVKRAVPLKAAALDEAAANEETSIKYIRLADLQDGVINDELCCLKELEPKWDKYLLEDGDIVISKITKPCKLAVYSKRRGEAVVMVGNMYALSVDEEKLNPYYLQAYLQSEKGAAALDACSTGSALPIISVEAVKGLQIPLLPMAEQNRIAGRCEKLLHDVQAFKRHLNSTLEKLGKVFEG